MDTKDKKQEIPQERSNDLAVAIRIYEHDYYSDKQELSFAFEKRKKILTHLGEITKRIIYHDENLSSFLKNSNNERILLVPRSGFLKRMWEEFADTSSVKYYPNYFIFKWVSCIYIVLSKEPVPHNGTLVLKELEDAGFKKGQEKLIYCFMGKQHVDPLWEEYLKK